MPKCSTLVIKCFKLPFTVLSKVLNLLSPVLQILIVWFAFSTFINRLAKRSYCFMLCLLVLLNLSRRMLKER